MEKILMGEVLWRKFNGESFNGESFNERGFNGGSLMEEGFNGGRFFRIFDMVGYSRFSWPSPLKPTPDREVV